MAIFIEKREEKKSDLADKRKEKLGQQPEIRYQIPECHAASVTPKGVLTLTASTASSP